MFASLKNYPEMLTANDLVNIFPLSRSRIYELMRDPSFPTMRLGRRVIVPRDALIDWLNNQLQKGTNTISPETTQDVSNTAETVTKKRA